VDTICGPGGALETCVAARRDGKARFLGFSAHSVDAALSLMSRFDFDTILFPFNYATWHGGNFGPQVLARARSKKMGILALKAMAKGPWPKDGAHPYPKCWYEPLSDPDDALLGLRFALSHPITAAIPPGDENLFELALRLAQRLKPLSRKETEALKARALTGEPIFRHPRV
jgi:predicted aldo/keto reductase-like oxidoreductase